MSTALAIREPQQELVRLDSEQIKFLAHTKFVPEAIRGDLPMIFATIATGREIGIGDMAALRHVHIIDGKPGLSAEIMVSLVRRAGHSIVGETSDTQATVTGTRRDTGDAITVTWTIDMARTAQTRVKGGGTKPLADKDNWRSYPSAMLWARAVSQLCRMLFADCFAGNTYTPEELGDDSSDERAVSHAEEEGPRSPTPAAGGSDDQAPGMGARTPEPPTTSGGEPNEAAASSQAVLDGAPASPPVDPAAGTPFGDDIDQPIEPAGSKGAGPPSAAMLKKLNVLVGKLRPEHLSTEQLYVSMGRSLAEPNPECADDGERLRWSPLRDSLTFSEAMQLIDRLERYAKDKISSYRLEDL